VGWEPEWDHPDKFRDGWAAWWPTLSSSSDGPLFTGGGGLLMDILFYLLWWMRRVVSTSSGEMDVLSAINSVEEAMSGLVLPVKRDGEDVHDSRAAKRTRR
jgi:hypothetical protein